MLILDDRDDFFSPLVSVIVPLYNGEKYIAEAMASIFAQTYPHVEVVVVNDGATDGSELKLSPYRDRIKYFHKSNGGIASAYNVGARECTGDFVCFLEQDDVWLPDKIETQVRYLLKNTGMDMVFCRYFILNERTPESHQRELSYLWPEELGFEDLFLKTLEKSSIITFSSALMRKSALASLLPFDERLSVSVDYDAWLKLAHHGKVGFLGAPLLKYRIHDSNTSSKTIVALQDDVAVLQKWAMRSDVRNTVGKEKVINRVLSALDALRYGYRKGGDMAGERRCLKMMLMMNPWSPDRLIQLLQTYMGRRGARALDWYYLKLKRGLKRR